MIRQVSTINMGMALTSRFMISVATCIIAVSPSVLYADAPREPGRHIIEVVSSIDNTRQPSYLILPPGMDEADSKIPVVVSLHSWSFGFQQRWEELEGGVIERGWIYLFPDFRGRNDTVDACASDIARRDVIDALDWVINHYPVDEKRVYLTGMSGGGFMTLAMVASFPERWTAASAWVPLSDLRGWYDFHAGDMYGEMTRQCVGGDPAGNPEIANEMRRRSPLYELQKAKNVPLEISAGSLDGHDGEPIPIWHSLFAFNVIADAVGVDGISAEEIAQLSRHEPRLDAPTETDEVIDPSYDRRIYLRRYAGKSRITIFEGAHERIPGAALAWFDAH